MPIKHQIRSSEESYDTCDGPVEFLKCALASTLRSYSTERKMSGKGAGGGGRWEREITPLLQGHVFLGGRKVRKEFATLLQPVVAP